MSKIPEDTDAKTTARGFEPLRAEPNGCLVHHPSYSVTLPMSYLRPWLRIWKLSGLRHALPSSDKIMEDRGVGKVRFSA